MTTKAAVYAAERRPPVSSTTIPYVLNMVRGTMYTRPSNTSEGTPSTRRQPLPVVRVSLLTWFSWVEVFCVSKAELMGFLSVEATENQRREGHEEKQSSL